MARSSDTGASPIDFRKPASLGPEQARALRAVHDDLCERLSPMLTTRLRNPLRLTVRSIDLVVGTDLTEAGASPSVVALCDLSPFPTPCALRIPMPTALVLIDILLGGAGKVIGPERIPTEVEMRVLGRLLEHCAASVDAAWSPLATITTTIRHVGADPETLGELPGNEPFLRIDVDMALDGERHAVDLWLPNSALAGAVRGFDSTPAASHPPPKPTTAGDGGAGMAGVLAEVPVEATVNFRPVPMSPAAILSIHAGDVIKLGPVDQTLSLQVGAVELGAVRPARNGTRTACQVVSTIART